MSLPYLYTSNHHIATYTDSDSKTKWFSLPNYIHTHTPLQLKAHLLNPALTPKNNDAPIHVSNGMPYTPNPTKMPCSKYPIAIDVARFFSLISNDASASNSAAALRPSLLATIFPNVACDAEGVMYAGDAQVKCAVVYRFSTSMRWCEGAAGPRRMR